MGDGSRIVEIALAGPVAASMWHADASMCGEIRWVDSAMLRWVLMESAARRTIKRCGLSMSRIHRHGAAPQEVDAASDDGGGDRPVRRRFRRDRVGCSAPAT